MVTARQRTVGVLVAFAVIFSALCVGSYRQKSATWDEPQHLLRGYLGWHGDHRLDPEHPPFLRLWDTLPLLAMGTSTPTLLSSTKSHPRTGLAWDNSSTPNPCSTS